MLSTTSEYALRALSVIATMPRGASIIGRDLARHTGRPVEILTTLHNAGIIGAARGSNGGYWLARPADSIRMQEVIGFFDTATLRRSCLLWPGRMCSEERPCSAHRSWRAVREEYLCFLGNVTLADISDPMQGFTPQPTIPGGQQL